MNSNPLKNKKANEKKLLEFGFNKNNKNYMLKKKLLNGDFTLDIEIENNSVKTILTENETGDIYTLHLTNAEGEFVGRIRTEYENILNTIAEKCFETAVFKSDYTYKVIEYINKKYNDKPEYLWEKFPDNAIFRRKDNRKWYAAILTVRKNVFGFKSDENVEVINLKITKNYSNKKELNENIYPAYHMNKKYWISIILDGSVELKTIYKKIDESYSLIK